MLIQTDKYFEGAKFLKAGDVKNGTRLTIEKAEEIKTQIGARVILRFKGIEIPLSLNKTNMDWMIKKYGNNTDKWIGKILKIRLEETTNPKAGGKVCDGIRFA